MPLQSVWAGMPWRSEGPGVPGQQPAVSRGVAARRGWEGSWRGPSTNPPSVAFDHWSWLMSAPVLWSSCLAHGCKVAFAGDVPFPSAGMAHPSLAWGHTGEVPAACGSVPCTSLGRVGSAGGASPGGFSGPRLCLGTPG